MQEILWDSANGTELSVSEVQEGTLELIVTGAFHSTYLKTARKRAVFYSSTNQMIHQALMVFFDHTNAPKHSKSACSTYVVLQGIDCTLTISLIRVNNSLSLSSDEPFQVSEDGRHFGFRAETGSVAGEFILALRRAMQQELLLRGVDVGKMYATRGIMNERREVLEVKVTGKEMQLSVFNDGSINIDRMRYPKLYDIVHNMKHKLQTKVLDRERFRLRLDWNNSRLLFLVGPKGVEINITRGRFRDDQRIMTVQRNRVSSMPISILFEVFDGLVEE
jgi:hypothetical protein